MKLIEADYCFPAETAEIPLKYADVFLTQRPQWIRKGRKVFFTLVVFL
jgi:hypothetical protein